VESKPVLEESGLYSFSKQLIFNNFAHTALFLDFLANKLHADLDANWGKTPWLSCAGLYRTFSIRFYLGS